MRDAVAPVFRQRRIAWVVFAAVLGGSLVWAVVRPRKYEAEMKILVNRDRVEAAVTSNADARAVPVQTPSVTEEELNSEVELLKSRDLLAQVVTACALDAPVNWFGLRTPSRSDDGRHQGERNAQKRLARAVEELDQKLVVDPLKKTNIIRVTYSSGDAELTARVLQTLAGLYEQKHAAVHRPEGTFSFFDREAERYRKELDADEARLAAFSGRKGLIDPALQKHLVLQQISQLETELDQDRASIAATERRAAELKAQESATSERQTTMVRRSDNAELLAQLSNTLMSLELKRREMGVKYAPDYPLVQEVDAQIADARKALAEAQQRPVQEITTDRAPVQDWMATEVTKAQADGVSLKARTESIARALREYKAVARQIDRETLTQSELMREMKTSEDNYLLYVRKREEARISDLLDQKGIVNVSIAEAATAPAFPQSNAAWVIISGLFSAAALSLGAAYAVDRMDPLFRTPDDVGRYLDLKVLAAIPNVNEAKAAGVLSLEGTGTEQLRGSRSWRQ